MGAQVVSADLSGDPSGDFLVIVAGCPDLAKEVGWVNVAVVFEKIEVAAAAVHDVGVEFAAEFGVCLGEDAGEVGDAV